MISNINKLDFKYWEDAADEFREPEGTLMPLWRFSPPAVLLRMFEENGSVRSQVPSHVTSICWNPHYKDLFAMGLGSRNNQNSVPEGTKLILHFDKYFRR